MEVYGDNNKSAGRDFIDNRKTIIFENDGFSPLRFFDDDIKEIIIEFAKVAQRVKGPNYNFQRIKAIEKNKINGLSTEYFEEVILENSISYFQQIDDFLKNPINEKYLRMYENTIDELNQKILMYRERYDKFDMVFNDLHDYILNNNRTDLRSDRRLIWVMLHYMYWKCDIGKGGEIGYADPS